MSKEGPGHRPFDLDGTLADTFAMIVAAWNEAVSPLMNKTYSDAEVARFGILIRR
jgi:phosphoglycolate phosphatase-like HAD superfamily hydrolase